MNKFTLAIAILLSLGGCSGGPAAPDASTASATTIAPASTDATHGPPQPPDPVTTTAPDAELEAAIRATTPDYRADITDAPGDGGKARYSAAHADLNGDGNDEVFVLLMGPFFCGTGGCTLLLFSRGMDGYSLLANIPTSDPPVIVAETGPEGYADFWRMQAGGGAPAEYVLHRYRDGKYVEASRTPAANRPAGEVVLDEKTDFFSGAVLEPRQ